MNGNGDWPILTFFHRMVGLFVLCATLIGLFAAWQLIQARPHVTKLRVVPTHRVDIDAISKAYREQGKAVPRIIEQAVTAYNEERYLFGFIPRFFICPADPVEWAKFLAREKPLWCEEEEGLPEEWFDEELRKQCVAFYDLLEARRTLISIVSSRFPFGEPTAACSISVTVALSGELDERELSFAADALERGEYVIVAVWLTNDSNVVAPEVRISGPEGFACGSSDAYETTQCGPFDLEVGEDKTVRSRAPPGRFLQKSELELTDMFEVQWKESEAIDTRRILLLLKVAGSSTLFVAFADLGYKLRKYRGQNWGKFLFGIVGAVLVILVAAIICMVRFLVI